MEVVTHVRTTTRKQILNELKINDFPGTRQRSEVTVSTSTINSVDTGESRELQLRYACLKQQLES